MNNKNVDRIIKWIKNTALIFTGTYYLLNVIGDMNKDFNSRYAQSILKGYESSLVNYRGRKEISIKDPASRNSIRPEYILACDEDRDGKFEYVFVSSQVGSPLEHMASAERIDSIYKLMIDKEIK